jgi:hypothetical protein
MLLPLTRRSGESGSFVADLRPSRGPASVERVSHADSASERFDASDVVAFPIEREPAFSCVCSERERDLV